jgi:hypothetical protein
LDVARDLGQLDPWQESLERSRARRNQPNRARRRGRRRARRLVASLGGAFALAALAVALPSLFGGHGTQPSLAAVQPVLLRPGPATRDVEFAVKVAPPAGALPHDPRTCPLITQDTGYANPLRGAKVTPERIDQGVDYAGSGRLWAIGAGRITYLATSETGWPGAFIEYRLSSGPDQGCYVYYAEGVTATRHLHVGQTVTAGQAIASIIPDYSSGIEIGWGAGVSTKTYAAELGQWDFKLDADSVPTRAGRDFSALIAALGGPPGKAEG